MLIKWNHTFYSINISKTQKKLKYIGNISLVYWSDKGTNMYGM